MFSKHPFLLTMIRKLPALLSSAGLGIMLLALAACECPGCDAPPVSAPSSTSSDNVSSSLPPSASTATSFYHMAPAAPPAPRYEDVPIPDNPRAYAWRPGYWSYSGGDFSWIAGEMMDRPDPTALWSPDHWIQHTYGWAFVPGYWQ